MHDPELIWRFGRWIARRASGAARLTWSDAELVLHVRRGNVISAEGPDPTTVSGLVGCAPVGHADLLQEATAVAAQHGIPDTQALAAAKEVLQRSLAGWLVDEHRTLELVEGEPDQEGGPTISIAHAIVELLLSDTGQDAVSHVLPDLDVVLRRAPDFLEQYSPLRLSEEADLVAAKITGQRTAAEIAARSPHGEADVIRLLAALVATGMLEPVPVTISDIRADVLAVDLPDEEPTRRRLPAPWILVAAAGLAIVLIVAVMATALRSGRSAPEAEPSGAAWGVVVDMGCEPQELQRVLKKARQHPNSLRPVQADTGSGDPCWRLVWGSFPSREAAERETENVPKDLLLEGFQAHPIELPDPGTDDQPEAAHDR